MEELGWLKWRAWGGDEKLFFAKERGRKDPAEKWKKRERKFLFFGHKVLTRHKTQIQGLLSHLNFHVLQFNLDEVE